MYFYREDFYTGKLLDTSRNICCEFSIVTNELTKYNCPYVLKDFKLNVFVLSLLVGDDFCELYYKDKVYPIKYDRVEELITSLKGSNFFKYFCRDIKLQYINKSARQHLYVYTGRLLPTTMEVLRRVVK